MIATTLKTRASFAKFVVLVFLMRALTVLSINAMLPALREIAGDLRIEAANSRQLIVSTIFLGLFFSQLLFGPLSDGIGRKPMVYGGMLLFEGGSFLSILAATFSMVLVGRLMQGEGASAPRTGTVALVRGQFSGNAMARVMTLIISVFIVVPSLGQVILSVSDWRVILDGYLLLTALTLTWFGLRKSETLIPKHHAPFAGQRIVAAIQEIMNTGRALGFTLAGGLIFGAFIIYLNSGQQIFREQYVVGILYPISFGMVTCSVGLATFLNTRLVMTLSMRRMVRSMLLIIFIVSSMALGSAILFCGQLPFWVFMAYVLLTFIFVGILFGNLKTLVMGSLGQVAGMGTVVIGALSTSSSVVLGIPIGQSYNATVLPRVIGLVVLSGLSRLVVDGAER